MYKFGFFFHLPSNSRQYQELILGFDSDQFNFYFVDDNLIPFKYHNLSSQYYELNLSVIFKNSGSKVTELVFLNDLDVISIKDKGLNSNSNFRIIIGDTKESHDLLKGQSSILEALKGNERAYELSKLLLERFICNKQIATLRNELKISPNDRYFPQRWQGVVNSMVEHINTIDIESLISTLWVKVWDYQRTKIGDDDTYYVYREAKLLDGTEITDPYLQHLIGLGEVCIEKESGYTSYFPRPNIPFGVYEGEDLENEKRKIIDSYSKEEHIGWLFYNQLFKQEDIKLDISNFKERINAVICRLENEYFYKELNNLDSRLFNGFSSLIIDHGDILKRLNLLLNHIQKGTQKINVIISGNIPFGEERKYSNKIEEVIEYLSRDNRFILITGNAKGAENISMRYALEHQFEIVCDYGKWTLMGRENTPERSCDMINLADMLIITESQSLLSHNLLNAAKAKGITVKIIR